MSHERSRTQQLRQTGRRAISPELKPSAHLPPVRIDEYGMSVGKAGEWLPDFDDMFDLEDDPFTPS